MKLLLVAVFLLAGCSSTGNKIAILENSRLSCNGQVIGEEDPHSGYPIPCRRATLQARKERMQQEAEEEERKRQLEALHEDYDSQQGSSAAVRGDGSPDDRECQSLGFVPGTDNYSLCRYGSRSGAGEAKFEPTQKKRSLSKSLAPYKKECGALGFKEETEKFGECVLRLRDDR